MENKYFEIRYFAKYLPEAWLDSKQVPTLIYDGNFRDVLFSLKH